MAQLWAALVTFNTLFMANLWLQDRTNRVVISVFCPAQNWAEVPVLGMGAVLLGAVALLGWQYAGLHAGEAWHGRIPSLWIDTSKEAESFRRTWAVVCFVVGVLFPLAVLVHFWRRLSAWSVWVESDGELLPSPYAYVSPRYLLDFNAHHYGDHSKRALDGWHGISFVPFWEPVLLAALSLAALVLSAVAAYAVLRSAGGQVP